MCIVCVQTVKSFHIENIFKYVVIRVQFIRHVANRRRENIVTDVVPQAHKIKTMVINQLIYKRITCLKFTKYEELFHN